MKGRRKIVSINENKDVQKFKNQTRTKLGIIAVLSVVIMIILNYMISVNVVSKMFAEEVNDFYKLNAQTIFTIDKIYLYSSAGANKNDTKRPIWDLDLCQYTDIAIYINNDSEHDGVNYTNSIKEMYIDNIKYTGPNMGNPELYFKDITEFGKFNIVDKNKVNDRLDYSIKNDGDLDYSSPEIYADCSNPITLEYVNNSIKKNHIISDISQELTFDGTLLRRAEIVLGNLICGVSFNIHIINFYNQHFIANVYIEIPLNDEVNSVSIYDGSIEKEIKNMNIKFFRIV